jgi:predicted Rossmann fold flavoprotein
MLIIGSIASTKPSFITVTDSSQTIIDCLMKEAALYGVEIRMNTEAKELKMENGEWRIWTTNGQHSTANYLCLATGGYPKATMFDWLKNLGHTFSEPVPSLFTFNLPSHSITALMGVSVEKARVKIEGIKLLEEGPVLITHWGLSGPAILRLSAWGARELAEKKYEFTTHINWLPEYNEQGLKEILISARAIQATKKILNHNFGNLPNRLWQFLLEASGVKEEMRFADLPAKIENRLINNIVDYVVEVNGKTTFKEEFVTSGGIGLTEVDANTMMSKKVPNLFFAGEVLDVDGITGGFNFQHAWTSGWVAAKRIAQVSNNN